ncbi:unnamed protein product [Closterium sp. Yama58-4]|nr:unnamed protein product [Closterium sp. Yama58-4]
MAGRGNFGGRGDSAGLANMAGWGNSAGRGDWRRRVEEGEIEVPYSTFPPGSNEKFRECFERKLAWDVEYPSVMPEPLLENPPSKFRLEPSGHEMLLTLRRWKEKLMEGLDTDERTEIEWQTNQGFNLTPIHVRVSICSLKAMRSSRNRTLHSRAAAGTGTAGTGAAAAAAAGGGAGAYEEGGAHEEQCPMITVDCLVLGHYHWKILRVESADQEAPPGRIPAYGQPHHCLSPELQQAWETFFFRRGFTGPLASYIRIYLECKEHHETVRWYDRMYKWFSN